MPTTEPGLPPPPPLTSPGIQTEPLAPSLNEFQAIPPAPALSTTPTVVKAAPHNLKWLWWTLGGVVVAGILGGGYFAYSKGFISIPFLTPKSDELFTKMVDSISTITSAQYSVRANLEAQPRGSGKPLFDSATANTNLPPGSGILAMFDPKEMLKAIPADVKIEGGMTLYVETDKLVQDANGMFKIDGTYTGSDTSLAVDLELRKVKENLYGIIRKFPSFFLFDLSAVKNKWVVATPDDSVSEVSTSTFENQDLRKGVDALKSATKRALDQKLFTVKQKLTPETVAGVRSEHYLISVDPEKLVSVYEGVRDERQARGEDVTAWNTTITDLKTPAMAALLKSMADNSKIEIWIDKAKGLLRQVKWGLTVVPDDSIERLKGKQLFISLTLTLDKVNSTVNIDKPSPTIDFDEATRLVTGITKEEQRFSKQTERVAKLRSALTLYKTKNQQYPASLEELNTGLKSIYDRCLKDTPVTNTNTSSNTTATTPANTTVSSATSFSIESIPPTTEPTSFSIESVGSSVGLGGYDANLYRCYDEKQYRNGVNVTDVYTNKPYGYTPDSQDYKLTYLVTLADAKNSYDKDSYADGNNTATSKDVSIEKTTTYEESVKKNQTSLNTNSSTTKVAVPALSTEERVRGTGSYTFVEYSDLTCPFCAEFDLSMRSLLEKFDGQVRLVYRQFPLSFNTNSDLAARGSLCVEKLGSTEQYWRYIETVSMEKIAKGDISGQSITAAATDVGVDSTAFATCQQSTEITTRLQALKSGGTLAGVTGTPTTFLVDSSGKVVTTISGALPVGSIIETLSPYVQPNTTIHDSDGDGISDDAESYVYRTDPKKSDTDGDSYTDKNEIDNGYNPLGSGQATNGQLQLWGKPTVAR